MTLKLQHFLDKNGIAEYSEYVKLSSDNICATNGRMIIKSTIEDTFGTYLPNLNKWLVDNGPIFIHCDEWRKIANKNVVAVICTPHDDSNEPLLQFKTNKTAISIKYTKDNIRFPQVDAVIPKESKSISKISLDIDLISRVQKALSVKRLNNRLSFHLYGDYKPVIIKTDLLPVTIILVMPLKP